MVQSAASKLLDSWSRYLDGDFIILLSKLDVESSSEVQYNAHILFHITRLGVVGVFLQRLVFTMFVVGYIPSIKM